MKSERKLIPIFVAGVLIFSAILILSGCSHAPSNSPTASNSSTPGNSSTASSSSGNVLVKSADGSISISVPAGWNMNDTGGFPSVIIGVSSNTDYQHVIVTTRLKSDFPANFTLHAYMANVKKAYAFMDTNLVWGPVSSTTIGGNNALTVELHATYSGKDLVYWISAIEGQNNYYCVSGWTTTSLAEQNKPGIENIINSFKEAT